MKLVALEERFVTPGVLAAWGAFPPELQDPALEPSSKGENGRCLPQLGEERFAAMADSGVDVQVLPLTTPGLQPMAPDQAVAPQTASNDIPTACKDGRRLRPPTRLPPRGSQGGARLRHATGRVRGGQWRRCGPRPGSRTSAARR